MLVLLTASTVGMRAMFTVPDVRLVAFAAIAMAFEYAFAAYPVTLAAEIAPSV